MKKKFENTQNYQRQGIKFAQNEMIVFKKFDMFTTRRGWGDQVHRGPRGELGRVRKLEGILVYHL